MVAIPDIDPTVNKVRNIRERHTPILVESNFIGIEYKGAGKLYFDYRRS